MFNVIEKTFGKCILAICFLFTSYFSLTQLLTYAKNEDMSVVSYRQFNSEPENRYPVFSVCFHSGFDGIFKRDLDVWIPNLITPRRYGKFVRGSLQTKFANPDILKNVSKINFEEVTIDFFEDLMKSSGFKTYSRNIGDIFYEECYESKGMKCEKPPIVKSHQNRYQIC